MKKMAKELGLKSVGVKKGKLLDGILDKIEEQMDVEGWSDKHKEFMVFYNENTEGGEEETTEEEQEANGAEDKVDLEEAEKKAVAAKEKVDKKKKEKKEKLDSEKSKFNHGLLKQAGFIDKALLVGMTIDDLAAEMKKGFGFEKNGAIVDRIKAHIRHLELKHGVKVNELKNGKFKIM